MIRQSSCFWLENRSSQSIKAAGKRKRKRKKDLFFSCFGGRLREAAVDVVSLVVVVIVAQIST